MATIVVFVSSLSVASVLVLVKAVELRHGKKNIVMRLLCQLDSGLDKLVASFKFKGLQLIQSIRYILLVRARVFFTDLFNKALNRIIKEYKIRQSAVIMGRKNISGNGSASFYLKKISEGRGNEEKGRIEDGSLPE
jgi:hypothetical protein